MDGWNEYSGYYHECRGYKQVRSMASNRVPDKVKYSYSTIQGPRQVGRHPGTGVSRGVMILRGRGRHYTTFRG